MLEGISSATLHYRALEHGSEFQVSITCTENKNFLMSGLEYSLYYLYGCPWNPDLML